MQFSKDPPGIRYGNSRGFYCIHKDAHGDIGYNAAVNWVVNLAATAISTARKDMDKLTARGQTIVSNRAQVVNDTEIMIMTTPCHATLYYGMPHYASLCYGYAPHRRMSRD